MTLRGNGQLLIEVAGTPQIDAAAVQYPGYALRPLSQAAFAIEGLSKQWLIAKPKNRAIEEDTNPWDCAHAAAQTNHYAHYVEPDIFHDRAAPAAEAESGLDKSWPPFVSDDEGVSPGWHLEASFTGFLDMRGTATGRGIRSMGFLHKLRDGLAPVNRTGRSSPGATPGPPKRSPGRRRRA